MKRNRAGDASGSLLEDRWDQPLPQSLQEEPLGFLVPLSDTSCLTDSETVAHRYHLWIKLNDGTLYSVQRKIQ